MKNIFVSTKSKVWYELFCKINIELRKQVSQEIWFKIYSKSISDTNISLVLCESLSQFETRIKVN